MSKFSTRIPVNINEIIGKLPKNSFIHSVELAEDRASVEIIWDNDKLQTAYTFPINFPAEKLIFNDKVKDIEKSLDKRTKAYKELMKL